MTNVWTPPDAASDTLPPAARELTSTLQADVAFLRAALAMEMAAQQADPLVAGLMERLPELAATVEDALVAQVQAAQRTSVRRCLSTPAEAPPTLWAVIRRLLGR
jgi:hypothetical protein